MARAVLAIRPAGSCRSIRFGLIAAGRHACADDQAVPAVDGDDDEVQVDQLVRTEMPSDLLIDVVRHVRVGHAGDGLGPGQCGALAFAVARRLAPAAEQIQTLLVLAAGTRVLAAHVQAVGTAVDLQCAHVAPVKQTGLQRPVGQVLLHGQQGLHAAVMCIVILETLFHGISPQAMNDSMVLLRRRKPNYPLQIQTSVAHTISGTVAIDSTLPSSTTPATVRGSTSYCSHSR